MNGYKRNVLLGYVSFLMIVSWVIVGGGILWALFMGLAGGASRSDVGLGAGILGGVGGLLYALGTALFVQVVAQLIRCLVRIEEHLDMIHDNSDISVKLATPVRKVG